MRQRWTVLGRLAGVSALLVSAGVASAGIGGRAITIIAQNTQDGVGMATISESDGSWDADHKNWTWNSTADLNIKAANGATVGTLENCHFGFEADPTVTLYFDVVAGNSLTSFSIMSGVLTFPTIINGQARATSAVTVTDNNGNGVSMTGTEPGGHMYLAAYNGTPGATFATLNGGPINAGGFDSNFSNDSFGFTTIMGAVTSIRSEFSFKLTAHDSASATSTFTIIPAPGSAALAVLGLLGARRRR